MSVDGIEYLYLETHDLDRSVEFWRRLGFVVGLDLGNACRLDPADGGTAIFVELVPADGPLAQAVYLKARAAATAPGPPGSVVSEFALSHWGTELARLRDPDGREYIVQRREPSVAEEPEGR